MISIEAYRAAIGGFYSRNRCILKKEDCVAVNDDCLMNFYLENYKNYISLCFVRAYNPSLIVIFEVIGRSLLLSGDVESNPGPETFDKNGNKTNTSINPTSMSQINNTVKNISTVTDDLQNLNTGNQSSQDIVSTKPPSQLQNRSNVCFANASFQLLALIPEFMEFVKNNAGNSQLERALNIFFSKMESSSQPIDTQKYVKYMIPNNWVVGTQQDAHEFINHIISQSYLVENKKKNKKGALENIFEFNLNELVVCRSQVCNGRVCQNRFDSMFFLNLPVAETPFPQSIDFLLDQYQSPENLLGYTCGKDEEIGCKLTNCCYKSQQFSETPANLLIQLKVYDSYQNKLNDLNISVDEELTVGGETMYLYGILYHEGISLTCGHYYSEIQYNGIWYLANDTHITPISKPTLSGHLKTPYILLYRKLVPEIHFSINSYTEFENNRDTNSSGKSSGKQKKRKAFNFTPKSSLSGNSIEIPIKSTNNISTMKMQEQALKEINLQNKRIFDLKNKSSNSMTNTIQSDITVNAPVQLPDNKTEKNTFNFMKRKGSSSTERSNKIRSNLTEEQKNIVNKHDNKRKKNERSSLGNEEKKNVQINDKKRKPIYRSTITVKQIKNVQEKDQNRKTK